MINKLEAKRLQIQSDLDKIKTLAERNRLGQFATPGALAQEILSYAKSKVNDGDLIKFLDPAVGSGAFYSALISVFDNKKIELANAFEIDSHYSIPAQEIWSSQGLKITHGDFTKSEPEASYNLIICNPPYVRHQHISAEDKIRLHQRTKEASGLKLSGLAGLYAHFLLQTHAWMAPGAIAGWLIPSEFMDVNYGRVIKKYLLQSVKLFHIHRFNPEESQFSDALVSSSIVWFKNEPPKSDNIVEFSYGGTLSSPEQAKNIKISDLLHESKWTRFPKSELKKSNITPSLKLGDFFTIKRGLATGNNNYFILNDKQITSLNIPLDVLKPIIPSSRYVKTNEILSDSNGNPINIEKLYLLDPKMDMELIQSRYPDLAAYIEYGEKMGVNNGYICRNRKRWYDQEQRGSAPIVCTYMGRINSKDSRPFRFIRNHSIATVANSYLAMYPKPLLQEKLNKDPGLIDRIWEQLNKISPEDLLGEGRVYGGGLYKLEPKELSQVPLSSIIDGVFTNAITNN